MPAFAAFVAKQDVETFFLITASLDRTVLFPIESDEHGYDTFIRDSLERFVSAFSISEMRAMSVGQAISKIQRDFSPYRDFGTFQEDYDLLALGVLSLASGVIHPDEIADFTGFRKQFFPSVHKRILKARWGLADFRGDGTGTPLFDSHHRHWRQAEMAELVEEMRTKIAAGASFNLPFRLAQNSVLLERIQDKGEILNLSLLRQFAYFAKRVPRMLIVGFTDMPLGALGLSRTPDGRAEPVPGRNSAFFASLSLI